MPSTYKFHSILYSIISFPPAAARIDEEPGDRFGRRDDFLSSRREFLQFKGHFCVPKLINKAADRQNLPPRDDVPLPTQPPYTAFIGNLAFDLTESELLHFFSGLKVRISSLGL